MSCVIILPAGTMNTSCVLENVALVRDANISISQHDFSLLFLLYTTQTELQLKYNTTNHRHGLRTFR